MEIITYQAGDKVYGVVRVNGATVYQTSEYLTERMAYADMYCWEAFQGGSADTDRETVDVSALREGDYVVSDETGSPVVVTVQPYRMHTVEFDDSAIYGDWVLTIGSRRRYVAPGTKFTRMLDAEAVRRSIRAAKRIG